MKIKRLLSFGSALVLSLSSILVINFGHAFAATVTWSGSAGDGKLATAGNWVGGVAPINGDSITFPANAGASAVTITNDLGAGVCINGITTNANSGTYYGYNITGLTLHVQGTITQGTGNQLAIVNAALCGNLTIANGTYLNLGTVSSPATFDLGSYNITISDTTSAGIYISGSLSGTGRITGGSNSNIFSFSGSSPSYSGTITANSILTSTADGLGTGGFVAATFSVCSSNGPVTIANNITVGGDYGFGIGCGHSANNLGDVTLTGTVTLTANTTVGVGSDKFTINGPLHGSYTLTAAVGSTGTLVINSSSNTSLTPNGNLSAPVQTISVDAGDDQPGTFVDIFNNQTYVINGVRGDTIIEQGGKLMGTGTVGQLSIATGGILAPGHSPGCLTSGNLSISGTYQAEIGGTTACTGYDQMKVTGTVVLSDTTNNPPQFQGTLAASLYNGYKPKVGETYVIISNDGTDAVAGTFKNLPEGATFTVSGVVFKISYKGGDGNDVSLTVMSVNTPNTGFALVKANPVLTLLTTTVLAGGILAIYRKQKFAPFKSKARRR